MASPSLTIVNSSLPVLSSVQLYFLSLLVNKCAYAFCLRETPRKTTKLSNPARAQAYAAQTDLAPPFCLTPVA